VIAIGAVSLFSLGHYTGKKSVDSPPLPVQDTAGDAVVPAIAPPASQQVSQIIVPAFDPEPTASDTPAPRPAVLPTRDSATVTPQRIPNQSETRGLARQSEDAVRALVHAAQETIDRAPRYIYNNVNPSQQELDDRAVIVADEADWRTYLLDDALQLTPAQQAAVFPIYARASQAYTPLLVAPTPAAQTPVANGGAELSADNRPAATAPGGQIIGDDVASSQDAAESLAPISDENQVLEEIYEVLEPDQQETLEDGYLDREAWWTEIVSVLEADADEVIAAAARPTVIDDVDTSGSDLSGLFPTVAPPDNSDNEPEKSPK
jgi:hypothetical protein